MVDAVQLEKAARFAALHAGGCFVLPNAWDVPSALMCFGAGFPAVGTTSFGVAFAHGLADGERIGRDRMLATARSIALRLPVPVTADLEAGYGATAEAVGETVRLAIAVGLVGCNIEDSDPTTGALMDSERAADRIRAAVHAASAAGLADFVVNARTDPFFIGQDPGTALPESVKRANLYLSAGARCAFVPGPGDAATARTLAGAIDGPLNLMAGGRSAMAPLSELVAAGVRRVSLGGSLMAAAYGQVRKLLSGIQDSGTFGYTVESGPAFAELARLLRAHPLPV
jgi:2-methylisocitrate lyase-like PEP mutase family enzyme